MSESNNTPLLEVENLRTEFTTDEGLLKAVDGMSFKLERGKILGLVGESGCGKSITGLSLIRLVPDPGKIVGGTIRFRGENVLEYPDETLRQFRGGRVSMVFQDPMMTLNPVLRIDTQLVETIQAHSDVSREAAIARSHEMLSLVGIAAPNERLRNYPHQLSGGMRQRIAIAIALCNAPDVIIADEPTTALDVTIQAQILSEIQKMCEKTGTSLVWITHDLGVVAGIADDICVMYAGKIVEKGSVEDVIDHPAHPYTRGLLNSVPSRNIRGELLHHIPGMIPNPINLPPGCAFRERCRYATEACLTQPEYRTAGENHFSLCHFELPELEDEKVTT
jgi:peptide/nickel transport system ATP-binding protein